MYMSMGNWGQAYNEFYEGFRNYQEAGNPNAKVGMFELPLTYQKQMTETPSGAHSLLDFLISTCLARDALWFSYCSSCLIISWLLVCMLPPFVDILVLFGCLRRCWCTAVWRTCSHRC